MDPRREGLAAIATLNVIVLLCYSNIAFADLVERTIALVDFLHRTSFDLLVVYAPKSELRPYKGRTSRVRFLIESNLHPSLTTGVEDRL